MRRQPLWYTAVAVVVSMVVMTGTTVVVSSRSARESERKWCSLIGTMDEAYSVTPPTTEIGQKLARDIKALRGEFGCP